MLPHSFRVIEVSLLARSGNGKEVVPDLKQDPATLLTHRVHLNKAVLGRIVEDKWAAELWQNGLEDAHEGRMRPPVPLDRAVPERCNLAPRFCVEQGTA